MIIFKILDIESGHNIIENKELFTHFISYLYKIIKLFRKTLSAGKKYLIMVGDQKYMIVKALPPFEKQYFKLI